MKRAWTGLPAERPAARDDHAARVDEPMETLGRDSPLPCPGDLHLARELGELPQALHQLPHDHVSDRSREVDDVLGALSTEDEAGAHDGPPLLGLVCVLARTGFRKPARARRKRAAFR